ncbi:hypothetical protein Goarm_009466 [Gossypium armourianum]|uniref:Uncharacterized protein n=1 Tax=Gossypium armourianum TaxID=34283 RepID=A0A7J9JSY7_9ROSI|nr:hypothetical protein [Gossypium armourianum]
MGSRSHKELTGDGAKMISYHKNHSRVRLEGNILLKALLEVQQLSDMDFFTTLLHCQPKSLVIFMLMDVALLVRRHYITASSIGTSSDWRLRPHYWTGYIVTIPLWFLGTLGISIFCPAEDTNSLGGSQGGNAGLLHFLSLHITYDVEYQQKMLSPEG